MANGTIHLNPSAVSGTHVAAKILWSLTPDTAANASRLEATLYARKGNTDYVPTIPTQGSWQFQLKAAGKTVTGSPHLSILRDWVAVGTLTATAEHTPAGTLSLAISGYVKGPTETTLAGHTASGSGTAVGDAIPRASRPTLDTPAFSLGDPVEIRTNRASEEFTHTLRYAFGTRSGTIAKKVGERHTWTAPGSLAEEIPGAKTGSGWIFCDTYRGSQKLGTEKTAFTLELNDPTQPVMEPARVALEGVLQVSTPRKASVYTHRLTWQFAGRTGILGEGVTTGAQMKLPLSWAGWIPDRKEAQGLVLCETFNGAVKIGEAQAEFTVTVPELPELKPEFTVQLQPEGAVPAAFSDLYIQGKTGIRAEFSPQSAYSQVAFCQLTLEGQEYRGNPLVTQPVLQPGEQTIRLGVTDGRGFVQETTRKLRVYDYQPPRLIPPRGYPEVICGRCREDGTLDPGGTWLGLKAGIRITSLEGRNQSKLTLRHRLLGSGWSDPVELTETEGIFPGIVPSTASSYEILLELTDSLGETSRMTFRIPTARAALHLRPGGNGAAFGKYAESDGLLELEPSWELKLKNAVMEDFVVEAGETGGFFYRKWHSGWGECWSSRALTAAVTTPWGVLFGGQIPAIAYPFAFQEPPTVSFQAEGALALPASGGTGAAAPAVTLLLPEPNEAFACRVHLRAAGQMKQEGENK